MVTFMSMGNRERGTDAYLHKNAPILYWQINKIHSAQLEHKKYSYCIKLFSFEKYGKLLYNNLGMLIQLAKTRRRKGDVTYININRIPLRISFAFKLD